MTEYNSGDNLNTAAYLALGELIVQITQTEHRDEVFRVTAQHLPRILRSDRASVALLSPTREHFEVFALEGTVGTLSIGKSIPLAATLVGEVVESGETTASEASVESPYLDAAKLASSGIRHIMNAPLYDTHGTIGTINIASQEAGAYKAPEIALLRQIAGLISSTLERQTLLHAARASAKRNRDYAKRLEVLNDIAQDLSSAMNEAQALDLISDAIKRIVPHDRVALAVLQPDRLSFSIQAAHGLAGRLGPSSVIPLAGTGLSRTMRSGIATYWPNLQPERYEDHKALYEDGLRSGLNLPMTTHGTVFASLNVSCISPDPFSDEDLTVLTMFASLFNATIERVKVAQLLEHQARHDALTGLPNRRELDRLLPETHADAVLTGMSSSLCYLDIDHFKTINDSYGHHAGDALLVGVIERILAILPSGDVLARIGGDEFLIVLKHCKLPDAVRVAERIRSTVEHYKCEWQEQHFNITASIGIAEITAQSNLSAIVAEADAACYLSKTSGRNAITVAQENSTRVTERRDESDWVHRIKAAIAQERFCVFAQPIYALSERKVIGCELLARMIDDGGLMVAPVSFIPIAERYNLITKIDQWMVEQATKCLSRDARTAALEVCTVNVSAASLESDAFLRFVVEKLRTASISTKRLGFEITESVAISQIPRVERFIETVRSLGCRVALDDFGSGFSSFATLKSLPVHFIKIDGTLVKDAARNAVDQAVIRAISELAKALSAQTIAEFVEDQLTLDVLTDIGVTHAQGYEIGAPVLLDDFLSQYAPINNCATATKNHVDIE